jgi:hypothetical protein
MTLAVAAAGGLPGDNAACCWEEDCAWYDADAEMCAVPMLSCSMWEAIKIMQRREQP